MTQVTLTEAKSYEGKKVRYRAGLNNDVVDTIRKVRQLNGGMIVAEMEDGATVLNIDLLHLKEI